MAVESRFVVIRQGEEVQTFMDKKAADEYDKMLDIADNLIEMLTQAPIELSESATEELSIYLAEHRDDVLVALQAKKAKAAVTKPVTAKVKAATDVKVEQGDVDNIAQVSTETPVTKPKPAKAPAKTTAKKKVAKVSEVS